MSAEICDSVYCLGKAIAKDLPDINGKRPSYWGVEVYSFPQGWSSTALGFGGIGGQALTTAQTTVIISGASAAVYFGRGHAYTIPHFNSAFMADVSSHNMAECNGASKYKAI